MNVGRFLTEVTATDGGPLRFDSHNKSFYAVLETQGVEIEQQADVIAAHAKIGQNLCFMNRQKPFYGLDLDDQLPRNDDVRTEASIHCNAFIDNWHINLPLEFNAGLLEFEAVLAPTADAA
jgi:hypothetical protein